ncbi:hypothetical protein NC996_10460 [Trichocoleus sp. ST-U2]|nr:hypothetical protein [Coleofasciculus sp. FACHB-SPT9]
MDASPLWMPSTLLPLSAYLRACFGNCSGISFLYGDQSQGLPQPPHPAA